MPVLQTGLAKSAAEAYTIDQSLRFEDGDDPVLSRTPASAGNRKTYTVSAWVKRGNLALTYPGIFSAGPDSDMMRFNSDDTFGYRASASYEVTSTAVFRDPSAWYHCMMVVDTTQSTEADRVKLYINGGQITALATTDYPAEDFEGSINNTVIHYIGTGDPDSPTTRNWDGYLAEVYFIDGTALDASSFGQTDTATNQWKPIDASGLTFGTNGFYQKYSSTELAASFEDSANHTAHTMTASGDVNTDTGIKKVGTASGQFDGTGDFLSAAASSDFSFASSDVWTIEGWVYITSLPGASAIYFYAITDNFRLSYDTSYTYWKCTAGSNNDTWSTTPSTDTWIHIAAVSDGTTVKVYFDGTEQMSFAQSGSFGASDSAFYIGVYHNGSSNPWFGNMDEFRLSRGIARYSGDFTPPTTAFTSDQYTKLLLHMDGADGGTTFTDSSSTGGGRHTITAVGNVANTRAKSKVGDSSIKFDGSGDALTIPGSSDFQFGTGDFTIECWHYAVGTPGTNDGIISWYEDDSSGPVIEMTGAQYQLYEFGNSGTHQDVSAFTTDQWNHIALVRNSAVTKFYLNGSETYSVSDTQDYDSVMGGEVNIGRFYSSGLDMDGYLDEIRISDTARYTGTFTPSTTEFTADANTKLLIHSDWTGGLGADSSGNDNDFTPTNLVATDQMVDSPTNNFPTVNPLWYRTGYPNTLSEGNLELTVTTGTATNHPTIATIGGIQSGKWYVEMDMAAFSSGGAAIGVVMSVPEMTYIFQNTDGITSRWYRNDGDKGYTGFNASSYGNSYTQGDIIGVAIDMDNGAIYFSKNNTWQNSGDPTSGASKTGAAFTDLLTAMPDGGWTFFFEAYHTSSTLVMNFGQDSSFAGNKTAQGNQDSNSIGDFYYEPPTDYLALCTSNLASPEIALPTAHFNTKLYTGDGATTLAVSGVGFQPDFTWIKNRSAADDHTLVDSVRGATNYLVSNESDAEVDDSTFVASLDSDGFTVGDDVVVNTSTEDYASWNWKAGTTFDPATAGTVTTGSGSANATAGFSIVKYTGEAGSITVGHGLSQAPEMIIAKNLDGTYFWAGYHKDIGNTKSISINDSGAEYPEKTWNDTTPSSTVFTLGASTETSAHRFNYTGEDFIAYCFHSVEGYSKVGSYEGNGDNDGTFVYTGFRPMWVMAKCSDQSGSWLMTDSVRFPYNVTEDPLFANESSAETNSSTYAIDILSNGFKCRGVNNNTNNSSGDSYIYLAFAESPFKTSNAR